MPYTEMLTTEDILKNRLKPKANAADFLAQVDAQKQAEPTKAGFINKTLDLLMRGNYASANVILDAVNKGEFHPLRSAIDGFTGKSKTVYSNVLEELNVENKWVRGGLGFVLDVALDPTTYLTFGAGLGLKVGGKALNKVGRKVFLGLSEKMGEKVAKEAMEKMVVETGGKYLATGGVKFAGKALPGTEQLFEKIGGSVLGPLKNIAKESSLGQWIGKSFIPNFKPEDITKADWNKIQEMLQVRKEAEAVGQAKIFDDAFYWSRKFTKKEREQIGNSLWKTNLSEKATEQQIREEFLKILPPNLVEPAVEMRLGLNKFYTEEAKRNLVKTFKEGYLPGLYKSTNHKFVNWGKPKVFENPAEAIAKGYKPIEDASKLVAARGISSIRKTAFYDFLEGMKNQFGQVTKEGEVFPGWNTVQHKWLSGTQFPKAIAHWIDSNTKYLTEDGINGFLQFFDRVQGFWKGTVTSLFPAFHSRNAFNNTFSLFLAGVRNPKRIYEAGELQILNRAYKLRDEKLITSLGEKKIGTYTYKEIIEQARKQDALNASWFGRELSARNITHRGFLMDAYEEATEQITGKGVKKIVAEKVLHPLKTGRQVGMAVENNARMTLFIDRLAKGDTFEEAARMTKKFLFDYGELAPFEKEVMRRVIPFYTFLRKNIPLQLEMVAREPRKYAWLGKIKDEIEQLTEDEKDPEKYLPQWMKEQLTIRLPYKGNIGWGYVAPDFGFQQLAETTSLRHWISQISPLIKAPFEYAANYDIFRRKKLADENLPPDQQVWEKARKSAINSIRLAGFLDRMTDEEKGALDKTLRELFGMPVYQYDLQLGKKTFKERQSKEKSALKRREKELKKAKTEGIIPYFKKLILK